MKRIHLTICLVLLSLLMASCVKEEPFSPAGDATPVELRIVTDNFVSTQGTTRASDAGYVTTFTSGDQIGIFAVSATAGILDKNIPYRYNGTAWVPVNAANTVHSYDSYLDDVTYFAYYPYSATMDDKKSEQEIIDAFTPKTNQTLYADYTASDLMTGAGTLRKSGNTYIMTFKLAHKMTLLVLCTDPYVNYKAPAGAGYEYHPQIKGTLTNAKINNTAAYAVGGDTYRLIVKPGTMDVPLEYTLNATTTSYTFKNLVLTAGTYRQFNLGHPTITIEREVQIGDYYCKGSTNACLIPGDIAPTTEQQAACIGIVYSTDVSRIGDRAKKMLREEKGITTPHGLVMALTNASPGNCKWGAYDTDENTTDSAEPFYQNMESFVQEYENVDGYGETHWIIKTYKDSGTTLKDDYEAFYYANLYGKTSETSRYAAPDNTTDWFMPSIGQWWDILSNLGGIDLSEYKNTGNITMPNPGKVALDNLNNYLRKISGETLFQNSAFYSSSELSAKNACAIGFPSNGDLYLTMSFKTDIDCRVRCVLAF